MRAAHTIMQSVALTLREKPNIVPGFLVSLAVPRIVGEPAGTLPIHPMQKPLETSSRFIHRLQGVRARTFLMREEQKCYPAALLKRLKDDTLDLREDTNAKNFADGPVSSYRAAGGLYEAGSSF
ncbi:MAG TPA: hypothetical protein VGF67_07385 [Ktedonobacteraceae bacterium]|jgi:hypothetical protein